MHCSSGSSSVQFSRGDDNGTSNVNQKIHGLCTCLKLRRTADASMAIFLTLYTGSPVSINVHSCDDKEYDERQSILYNITYLLHVSLSPAS